MLTLRKANGTKILFSLLLIMGICFVIGLQTACEKKKVEETVVGFPKSFADLAAQVEPAVVNISTTSTMKVTGNPFRQFFGLREENPFGGFFHQFFGDIPDRELKQQILGSGFIVDKDSCTKY